MCNSTDLVKKEGLFVCESCGMKYTHDEIRKLYVEVTGSVKLDHSDEVVNLYKAARNARQAEDTETALKNYEAIIKHNPDSWEAMFYITILRNTSITYEEIEKAAINIYNCLPKVFDLIKSTVKNMNEQKAIIEIVTEECYEMASWYFTESENYYKSLAKSNGLRTAGNLLSSASLIGSAFDNVSNYGKATGAIDGASGALSAANLTVENTNRCMHITNIMVVCGNQIEQKFDMKDSKYSEYAVWCWMKAIDFQQEHKLAHRTQSIMTEDALKSLTGKIEKYSQNHNQNDSLGLLMIKFDANAGAATELWYSLDGGEKQKLTVGGMAQHRLPLGEHTIKTLNPLRKKSYTFELKSATTINILAKAFSMKISQ